MRHNQPGMTLKQMARAQFFAAVDEWGAANRAVPLDAERLTRAGVTVHIAKGGVPKSLWPMVRKAVEVDDEQAGSCIHDETRCCDKCANEGRDLQAPADHCPHRDAGYCLECYPSQVQP